MNDPTGIPADPEFSSERQLAPATFAQQRLWFLDQLQPDNIAYLIAWSIPLKGILDSDALQRAVEEVVNRHDVLRATYFLNEGTVWMSVPSQGRVPLPVEVVSGTEDVRRIAEEEARKPIDLARGPMVRGRLLCVSDDDHTLLVTLHHIAFDGSSRGIFAHELQTLYNAFREGKPSPLPPPPLRYSDYAQWQRKSLERKRYGKLLDYWKKQLADLPEALNLPTDRPRPATEAFRGATKGFVLPGGLSKKVIDLAKQRRSSLFMVTLAAFQVLLAKYSGQDDIVTGVPVAGRDRPELEGLIGLLANELTLRLKLSQGATFLDLLAQAREASLDAFEHQDMPFDKLVLELNPERQLSRNPLFQVLFSLRSSVPGSMQLDGLEPTAIGSAVAEFAKFDLSLYLREQEGEISGWFEYNTDLFDESTIERMASHFQTLLEGIVEQPETPVADLPLLTEHDRRQLLVEFNATDAAYPAGLCLHDLVTQQAKLTPDAIAISCGGQRVSYRELNTRANQIAHYLRKRGAGPDVLVGLCSERNATMLVSMLGILKAGSAYVPLDPNYPKERIRIILEDAHAPLVLTQSSLLGELSGFSGEAICLDTDWPKIASEPEEELATDVKPENLGYVLFTSGSTGRPKGVALEHRSAATFVHWAKEVFTPQELSGVLLSTSICFDLSVFEIFVTLSAGGKVIVAENALHLPELPERDEVTLINTVPSAMAELVRMGAVPASVETVNLAGEALPDSLVEQIYATTGVKKVYNLYGPTEDTTYSTYTLVRRGTPVTIGRPVANTQAYILDEKFQPVPIGVPGQLYLAGEGLARGYYGRPDLTEERFIGNPLRAGTRMYRTGDVCRWQADGNIQYLGRADHQVKLRGFRIELGEIEAVLNRHAAVRQSLVMVREDEPGLQRLVAYIVPNSEQIAKPDDTETEQVSDWTVAWEESYREAAKAADATFNITGWNSSYTLQPIPASEMHTWVDSTVNRILQLEPKRVWEIGCGTGLLLFRIAGQSEHYHGTDISQNALQLLRGHIANPERNLQNVTLERKAAHEFDTQAGGTPFDLVILNSVIQYFPDIEYLTQVLTGAVRSVGSKGAVFIGDVRSLPLLKDFHTSVKWFQAGDTVKPAALSQRIDQAVRQEEELVVDPDFFLALRQKIPGISRVEIQLKRGRERNELTRFRYDVTLHVGEAAKPAPAPPQLDWSKLNLTPASLREILTRTEPEVLVLTKVPNARIEEEIAVRRILERQDDSIPSAAALREILAEEFRANGVEPEDLWKIEEDLPYTVEVRSSHAGSDGLLDVMLCRKQAGADSARKTIPRFPGETDSVRRWENYANNPLRQKLLAAMTPQLREWVSGQLPEFMAPSAFVLLDSFPLSPNGKVNRRALPQPEMAHETAGDYVAPRTEAEKKIAEIWSAVLHISRIGTQDNFFSLGGHSLLATQVLSRLRQAFEIDLPLRAIFEAPTVAELAKRCDALTGVDAALMVDLKQVDRSAPLPLSFGQQRLWFLNELDPANPSYNITFALRLTGNLHPEPLRDALTEIVRRHEALRTRFVSSDGEPAQIVCPPEAPEFLQLTARDEDQARELIRSQASRPFDLGKAPLIRAALISVAPNDHVLVLIAHHIVSDGWSSRLIEEELRSLYTDLVEGKASGLAEPPIQYGDYAVWQRQHLSGETLDAHLDWWKQQLAGAPAALELPTDRPRPPVETFRGAKQTVVLSPGLLDDLRNLSRAEGTTLFMTLLTAFSVLLSRYSGQEEVVIGSPIAGRNRAETEKAVGLFLNTVVLRVNLAGNPPLRELLGKVRETALGAYAHQELPFEKLVAEIAPERDFSRNPLFQAMLILQNLPAAESSFAGLAAQPFPVGNPTSKFDITLIATELPSGLRVTLEYSTDLFDDSTIARMHGHFEELLRGIVSQPEQPVLQLPLLNPSERERSLFGWNATALEYPRNLCLHQWIEQQAQQTPERLAVSNGTEQLTYGQLNALANQVARGLMRQGAGPATRVAIRMERSTRMLAGLLGILKSGGAYVPLDPHFPEERIEFILRDADACLTLDDQGWERFDAESQEDPGVEIHADDLAYILHTSGSTGRPKGVEITHRNLVNFLASMQREPGLSADDVLVAVTTLSFDIAGLELYLPLVTGAQVVIASREQAGDANRLLQLLEQSRATVLQATPATWRMLLDSGWQGNAGLKALCGGEALPAALAEQLMPRCRELWNMYGPTETTIWSSVFHIESDFSGNAPLGRPIANTTMYVLDSQNEPVPVGVTGELYIGGDGVARGYWKRPELTAEKFLSDPFVPDARIYRTGDLARYDANGIIHYLGRADFQVKVRGFRIELGEVETALARHQDVRESVAIATESQLVAYVTLHHAVSSQALRDHLKASLPDYMVPSAIIVLEGLPLTPNGKVDRKALAAAKIPRPAEDRYVAPRTSTEIAVAAIWEDVLRIPQVGAEDDFFELGGHSLLATRVISRAQQVFGVDLPLRALFEHHNLAAFAVFVDEAVRAQAGNPLPAIAPIPRDQPIPLSFVQQRLWFLNELEPGNPIYNVPSIIRLQGPLNVSALQRSVDEIVRRHEALRTRFGMVNGEPVQIIDAWSPAPITQLTASAAEGSLRDAEVLQLVEQQAVLPFDLTAGPLFRAALIEAGPDDHILVLNSHHIVSDAWSIGVIRHELSVLYEAFLDGGASPLEELPIQYADYAVWQRQVLAGDRLEKQMAYWRNRLLDAPAALELPTDRPRPNTQTYTGAQKAAVYPESLLAALKELSHREGVTLFMTVLAAVQVLLSRYTAEEDIVIGSPIAGRTRTEVEGLAGFFVNTLVLRTSLHGNPSFTEALQRVKESTLGAYAHQDIPFEKLVEELRPDRGSNRTPLFQVMVALQNVPLDRWRLPGLSASRFPIRWPYAKFDLMFFASETPEGLRVNIEYNTGLFDEDTIVRIAGHLGVLLEGIAANASQPIGTLPILTPHEQKQLLIDWNDTQKEYPQLCIHEIFEQQAERNPNAIAIAFRDATLTYGELNERSTRLANHLRSLGVGVESRVGICIERSPEMIVGLLGILKAGGAYVPLEPGYPLERIAFLIRNADAQVVLTVGSLAGSLPADVLHMVLLDEACWPVGEPLSELWLRPQPDGLAYVMYTSGSTGEPKGVATPHRGVVRLVCGADYARFGEQEVILQAATLSFDASTFEIWGALLHGAKLVLYPGRVPELGLLKQVIADQRISTVWLTTSLFNWVIDEAPEILSAVNQVLAGGEALSVAHIHKALALLPSTSLINGYGPTETTTFAVSYRIPRDIRRDATSIPIGYPISNTTVYVLDRRGELVPIGVSGELYIGGPGVAHGYLGQPELTGQKFVANPFSSVPGERLYATGDLVRHLSGGEIEFLGRLDSQVKIRGFRVEPGEVEAALAKNPHVRDCVVTIREDTPGDKRIVAYVLSSGAIELLASELRSWLKDRLPEFLIPAAIVLMDAFPLNRSGKVSRKDLPAPEYANTKREYQALRTPVEEIVAEIWASVLKLDRIGTNESFFELGGHSLLATRVVSRIRESFGIDVPLRAMFDGPTVEDLSRTIENLQRSKEGRLAPALEPVVRDRGLPLSFAQQRLWFIDQLDPLSPLYNVAIAMRLTGELNSQALGSALHALVERHEILRTVYRLENDRAAQFVLQDWSVPLTVRGLEDGEEAGSLLQAESERPFRLDQDLLLRAFLLQIKPDEHVLLLTTHHIATDGWSNGILKNDLMTFYNAAVQGEPASLSDLRVQYADYAVWQRNWLQGEVLRNQLDYWRKQLTGAPPVLTLPSDRPRAAVPSYRGGIENIILSAELMQAARGVGRSAGATSFMTMLAAFQILMAHYSRQTDIVLGTDLANRNDVCLENIVGFFVNLLVLRADLSGNPTFTELLQRVRDVTLGAYSHQDVPFEKLVEELQPERSLSSNLLVQVLFVQQNVPRATGGMHGLEVSGFPLPVGSKFDMAVFVTEREEGAVCNWVYSSDLFDPATIVKMGDLYSAILGEVSANPEYRINDLLEWLAERERASRASENREFREVSAQKLKKLRRRVGV